MNLIVSQHGRFLFGEEQVVFTTGYHPPVLAERQRQEMERQPFKRRRKLVIAIPYKEDALQGTSYTISDNYLHVVLSGAIASSFDKSKVVFPRHTMYLDITYFFYQKVLRNILRLPFFLSSII